MFVETVYALIDYLTYTLEDDCLLRKSVPSHVSFEPEHRDTQNNPRYREAFPTRTATIYRGNANNTILVNMSGQPLAKMRELGFSESDLLKFVFSHQKLVNVTRCDTTLDIVLSKISVPIALKQVADAIEAKEVKTRTKDFQTVLDTATGNITGIYAGSKGASRRLLMYDKKHERNKKGIEENRELLRVEFVTRKDGMSILQNTLMKRGIELGAKALIFSFFNAPTISWWQEVARSHVKSEKGVKSETDRMKWYRTQVLPALKKDVSELPELAIAIDEIMREELGIIYE